MVINRSTVSCLTVHLNVFLLILVDIDQDIFDYFRKENGLAQL